MQHRCLSLFCVSLFAACLLSGCGAKDPLNRRAVSGTVTLDGQPLKQGSIAFEPLQPGGVSSGALITDGQYAVPADKGLPQGKYRVSVTAGGAAAAKLGPDGMPGDAGAAPKELIPAIYNTASKLTAEVGETDSPQFDFQLKSK
jgi:hypothetical protein